MLSRSGAGRLLPGFLPLQTGIGAGANLIEHLDGELPSARGIELGVGAELVAPQPLEPGIR